jgi:hypothetical protein
MSINTLLTNPTIMSGLVGDIYQYLIPEGAPIPSQFPGITISNNKIGDVYKVDINLTIVYNVADSGNPTGQLQCAIIAYIGDPINLNFIPASVSQCDIQNGNYINLSSSFVCMSESNSPLQITFQATTKDNLPFLNVYAGAMVMHHLPNSNFIETP